MRLRSITDLGGGGVQFLLLALLVSLAALAGFTLSAAAQTDDDGADDAPQGRIIARIQDRTDDDGVDDYRIEFGFFPQWAMEDKDPWAEAITTWSDWLPRARYLTKMVVDRRDADDNRRWLRSSLISVPAGPPAQQSDGGPDADLEDEGDDQQGLIEGRVVARYNPDSRGRLRVEFGFLPEWAFSRTANTEEAVEQYGEGLLPRARYLTAAMIESRRGAWLRSSVVDVPPPPTGCAINITSSPVSVTRGEEIENRRIGTVECEITDELNPISVMGTPSGLTIRAIPAGTDRWNLTLSGAATADADSYTVEITVRPAQGDPVPDSVTIDVNPPDSTAVRVDWRGYNPDEIAVLGDASPRVEDATVVDEEDGRAVRPQPTVTFEVDEAAEEVCDVNRNNGRITPLTAGACVVVARSAETDQYAAGESDPVRVTITRVSPDLRWDGYDEEDLREGGDPARPREPQPRLSEARGELSYTYSATPSSICAVNSRTGDLTPHREGECDITVRSAETDKFLADEFTISARITGDELPRCGRIPTVGPLDPGETDTINLDNYCEDPDGEDLRYSDAQSDDRAVATVRLIGSTLTVTAADAPAGESAQITVTAADPAGNETEARINVRAREILPPEIRSITCRPSRPASRPEVNERVECTAEIRGGEPDDDGWNWSGGEPSGPSDDETYRTVFRQAGDQPVDLTVSNAAGRDSSTIMVSVTQEAPQIIRISCSPPRPDVDENVTCEALLRGGEPDDDGWDWSGGDSSGSRETYDTSFRSSGRKTVRLTVSNSAGSDSDSITVVVPESLPEIRITCPASADVDEPITCTVDNRGGAIDRYSWSGGDSRGSRETYDTSFSSPGTKTVRLTARNSAGSDDDSTTVEVQPGPPEISVSCPESADVDEDITCTVDNRGGAIDTYSWSDSDGGSGSSSSYRTSFGSAGTYTVSLAASNAGGDDRDTSGNIIVTAPPPREPDISISCSPSSIEEGDRTTCEVRRNSGGEIDTYSWSASGGSPSSDSSRMYRVRFNTAGTYTVSLTASNDGGDGSDSTSVTVAVEEPDISIRCSPLVVDEDESVTCEVRRNSGGEISTYSWSDSDGGSGSGATYSTSFDTAGRYTVTLTASNAGGSDTSTRSIEVDEPPVPNVVTVPVGNIWCSSATTEVGSAIRCVWSRTGGHPATSLVWSGGDSSGSSENYYPSFSSTGSKTVRLDVSNSAGSANASVIIRVVAVPPSSQYARCGSDAIKVYWFDRTNYQKRHLDITGDQATAIFGLAWWNTIGHMSQSACDSWPTGSRLTGQPPS